jgi:hypothetical protein
VLVPKPVAVELDGRHAEIRIEQSAEWDAATHFPPTGTKYPCMGCYLYFAGEKINVGKWMGPLWVTNAALTTQLEKLLLAGKSIGKLGTSNAAAVAKQLAATYAALPPDAQMGKGVTKDGETTFDRQADSDSELDEDEYASLQKRVPAFLSGAPLSPLWEGVDDWEPPTSAASKPAKAVPGKSKPNLKRSRGAIDTFNVNGVVYAANDPRIRSGGECLWDTLRSLGINREHLEAAAAVAHLTIDQHVMHDDSPRLLAAVTARTGTSYNLTIDFFGIDDSAQGQMQRAGVGGARAASIRLGMMVDPHAQGHYVPPWSG